jgi:hypothetical protein
LESLSTAQSRGGHKALHWSICELSDDNWASEELPEVIALSGGKAIKPLREFLFDSSNKEFARATAANCFEAIGKINSSLKNDCISILAEYLEQVTIDVPTLNGLVIEHLIGLNAVGSMDVIRKAFNTRNVEIKLGLRTKRETPQPKYVNPEYEDLASIFDSFKAKNKKNWQERSVPLRQR